MLMVDMRDTNARITIKEILSSGTRWVSNPFAFSAFASGLAMNNSDLLLDKRWRTPAGASSRFGYFNVVMHELLPAFYDVTRLKALGGRFALRLTDIGDFTVIAMNRRVVTLAGLPLDDSTGNPIIDVEMRGDVFMAMCNELLADLAERTLKTLAGQAASGNA